MRGQQHAELVLGDRLHQHLQELAPGQRVEAGDRLVEDQQLGALGEAEGERELGALAAGQLAGPLRRGRGRGARSGAGPAASSQPRVEVGAEPQVVGDASARRTSGCPGRRSRPWPAAPGSAAGRPPQHLDRARRSGVSRPTARFSSVRLAGAVGADQPGDPAGGDLQGAVRQRPPAPVLLAQALGPRRRRSRDLLVHGTKRAHEERLDALVVEPGQPGLAEPAPPGPGAAARARPARRRPASGSRTCRPPAGRRRARRARARGRP